MVLFNYATKEITAKIVYYGPGLCGKTTNLQFIYESLPSNNRSKMLSLATKQDRTLFFDFLPLDLGKIRGMRTKLQLYTVPGQVYYNSTRQLVLKGADGVVFVADSQATAVDANLESWQNLEDNLKRQGIRIREIPIVIQYNKRDLPNALPVPELNELLNKMNVPTFESVATTGLGVEETLRGMTQVVLDQLVKKYGLSGSEPLDREIKPLASASPSLSPAESGGGSVWVEDNVLASEPPHGDPLMTAADLSPSYVVDEDRGENLVTVPTQLVSPPPSAYSASEPFPAAGRESGSFEPEIEIEFEDRSVIRERRSSDGLIKDILVPVRLSAAELRGHRRIRLRLQIDIDIGD